MVDQELQENTFKRARELALALESPEALVRACEWSDLNNYIEDWVSLPVTRSWFRRMFTDTSFHALARTRDALLEATERRRTQTAEQFAASTRFHRVQREAVAFLQTLDGPATGSHNA